MLEQLIKLVQQNSGDDIVKNPEVPNEFNNAAIQDVAKQILNGLQGQASKGNMQDIMLMFQGSRSSISEIRWYLNLFRVLHEVYQRGLVYRLRQHHRLQIH